MSKKFINQKIISILKRLQDVKDNKKKIDKLLNVHSTIFTVEICSKIMIVVVDKF